MLSQAASVHLEIRIACPRRYANRPQASYDAWPDCGLMPVACGATQLYAGRWHCGGDCGASSIPLVAMQGTYATCGDDLYRDTQLGATDPDTYWCLPLIPFEPRMGP